MSSTPTRFRSDAEALEGYGFDPRNTPVDTLMSGPLHMHLDVADAMNEAHDFEADFDA